MFGLILAIASVVALGCLIAYAVVLTFRWLKNKIKEKLTQKNAKKVAVADLSEMIDSCENKMSLSDLENLQDEGYTHLVATVDNNGQVSEVEVIKNTADDIDEEVERFINRTGEGMVVIER